MTLKHEGNNVREFYSSLPRPVRVGIESHGSDAVVFGAAGRVGNRVPGGTSGEDPGSGATRSRSTIARDAELILKLLVEKRFPAIWLPSKELLDLRALLLHRHQWVRMRTRIQNALQAIALANGLRRGHSLWSNDGQRHHRSRCRWRRIPRIAGAQLQTMYAEVRGGDRETEPSEVARSKLADDRSAARRLMTHPGVGPVTALATEVFLGDPASVSQTARP